MSKRRGLASGCERCECALDDQDGLLRGRRLVEGGHTVENNGYIRMTRDKRMVLGGAGWVGLCVFALGRVRTVEVRWKVLEGQIFTGRESPNIHTSVVHSAASSTSASSQLLTIQPEPDIRFLSFKLRSAFLCD
ncbi:hypothetical protein M405DRAFT_583083 [Rhizopogon salebrosus TDB-379]|nr:hypothetical protein M405DRAFT_583083 [Rhizopogon salebrosus TDB-379]